MQSYLDANFLGEIVTSQAVLDHLGGLESATFAFHDGSTTN